MALVLCHETWWFGVGGMKNQEASGRWNAAVTYRREEERGRGDAAMSAEIRSRIFAGAAAHPVSELLACPPATSNMLTAAAQTIPFESGEVIFRQGAY